MALKYFVVLLTVISTIVKSDSTSNVSLYVDSHSWLSFAFPVGTRMCSTTKCTSTVLEYPTHIINNTNSIDISVFLTSWGGRQSSIIIPQPSSRGGGRLLKHASVFMENDLRFFQSQEALNQHLLNTIYPSFDLAFGFTSNSIVSFSSSSSGDKYKLPEWKQLAYIDDPISSFSMPSALSFNKMINKIAFFSSQCSPLFAEPRIAIMQDLSKLLGAQLSSFGNCFNNAELSTVLPQCAGIPVHNVDHG